MPRSQKTKDEFLEYLNAHPEQRFWQAVANFSGVGYLIASDQPPKENYQKDVFFEEENFTKEEDDIHNNSSK